MDSLEKSNDFVGFTAADTFAGPRGGKVKNRFGKLG